MKIVGFLFKKGTIVSIAFSLILIISGIFFFKNIFVILAGIFPLMLLLEIIPNKDIIIAKNSNNASAINYMQKLIKTAKCEILIFSRSLNPDIYEDFTIIESLEFAKKRGVIIKAIVNKEAFESSHLNVNSEVKRLISEKVLSVYTISDTNNPNFFDKVNHFCVVDEEFYRLEKKHSYETKNEREAVIGYLPHKAKELKGLFMQILCKIEKSRMVLTEEVA